MKTISVKKTIGDVVEEIKKEGKDEVSFFLDKLYKGFSQGFVRFDLKDLEELSPDLDVEEYMKEIDGCSDLHWSSIDPDGDISLVDILV